MNPIVTMSDLTVDYADFLTQFNNALSSQPAWSGTLTTTTSQTLIGMVSSVGAYAAGRIYRCFEDAFPETAVSDSAIYSAAFTQGLRLARYTPASISVNLSSPIDITIPAYTQFTVSSYYYFNRQPLVLIANTPQTVTMFEGQIMAYSTTGLGTQLQAWVSPEDSFVVANEDVQVSINQIIIPKALGGLWNYSGVPAYSDLTLRDGRLLIQFGNNQFGSTPQVTDTVLITYPITHGMDGNNQNILNQTVSMVGFVQIAGPCTTAPQGGANQQSSLAYKNLASGSFGTYSSAVTASQYKALVGTYPGIVDAITQAQREINPLSVQWMNVIRVSALTSSTWSSAQIQQFLSYMQSITMYAPYFIWQNPIAVPNNVSVDVYCYNTVELGNIQLASASAITQLFAPKPGILLTDLFVSDIEDAIQAASPGLISYVIVNEPVGPMIVSAPKSPLSTLTQIVGGGTLGSLVYAYSVASVYAGNIDGPPVNWSFTTVVTSSSIYGIQIDWQADPNAISYNIYGRSASALGLLINVSSSTTTWIDDGSLTPTGGPPNTIADVPIKYNTLNNLTVNVYYSNRQQRFTQTPFRGN